MFLTSESQRNTLCICYGSFLQHADIYVIIKIECNSAYV